MRSPWLVSGLLLTVFGCSSGDAPTPEGTVDSGAFESGSDTHFDVPSDESPDAPHDEATATSLAKALCDQFDDCCTKAGLVEDHDACTKSVASILQPYVDHAEALGAVPDPSALPACRDALAVALPRCGDVSEDSSALAWTRVVVEGACSRVVGGKQPAGATCKSNFECAQPANGYAYCLFPSLGATEGACQSVTFAKVGEACAISGTTHAACEPRENLQCFGGKCTEGAKLGEPCFGRLTCTNDLWCEPTTNHCAARTAPGSACDGLHDSCVMPGRCDATTKTCVALSPLGAPCTGAETCASRTCGSTGKCAPNDSFLFPGAASSCKPT